ncbi:MAG: PQQ-binding-like beta-propeller repeat protein [Planctomycetes bacterium]|nr:PQQ-binding-like beta-propeller repeat protein [Planctomycetota bacterium]
MISKWPLRGGPVIADGKVYFSAGIWPFMGVFIYALDAESGEVIWLNDHDSIDFVPQPHKPSMAFAGVAPQGAFALNGDHLIVPGGRSVPAVIDIRNGDVLRYDFAKYSKKRGGDFVASTKGIYFTRAREHYTGFMQFDLKSGRNLQRRAVEGGLPIFDGEQIISGGKSIRIYSADEKGVLGNLIEELKINAEGDVIKAGDCLYVAGEMKIQAVKMKEGKARALWQLETKANVVRLIAANECIYAVTDQGDLLSYGYEKGRAKTYDSIPAVTSFSPTQEMSSILKDAKSSGGWALFYGLDQKEKINTLLSMNQHNIIVIDPSLEKVNQARRYYDDQGVYGRRITIHHGSPLSLSFPSYLFELAFLAPKNAPEDAELLKLTESLRPYGGSVVMPKGFSQSSITKLTSREGFESHKASYGLVVKRKGPLPGASTWTHNYGNIAATAKSDDKRVKVPLGVLWWGGSNHTDVLPRHSHGPSHQVVGGRLYVQGENTFKSLDVYTGRTLWSKQIPGLNKSGIYYNETYNPDPMFPEYNQVHIPGANSRGSNFVVTEDTVYLLKDERCLLLDSATGKEKSAFELSRIAPKEKSWAYIGVQGDCFIGGAGFSQLSSVFDEGNAAGKKKKKSSKAFNYKTFDYSASKSLVIMDRHSGKEKWRINAKLSYIHNGIVASDKILFVLDKLPQTVEDFWRRRGKKDHGATLSAYELSTGKLLWEKRSDIFGTYLSYSARKNLILMATRPSRDMAPGEKGKGMIAFNAATGKLIWDEDFSYRTFPILHNDVIITENGMWDLLTGKEKVRINPINGEEQDWSWKRTYGCNYPIATEYMLNFRSGAASFYDLAGDGGTGSFGGFKSGCSINLIAADGVISAPDYTRTCICSYQNQTSLALVHMPELEFWTSTPMKLNKREPIKRLGLNFGAPGDRKEGETYWLDYPSVGGDSPDPDVEVKGKLKVHLDNALRYSPVNKNWVYASCVENIESLSLKMGSAKSSRPYRVKLYFAEVSPIEAGQRVFDVEVQGGQKVSGVDVIKRAGGVHKGFVLQFDQVPVKGALNLHFSSKSSLGPILSGIEVVETN